MQINIWPTTNRKEYTRACDCKRRSQQTLPIGRSWPNRNQSYDQKIVRSGVTGAYNENINQSTWTSHNLYDKKYKHTTIIFRTGLKNTDYIPWKPITKLTVVMCSENPQENKLIPFPNENPLDQNTRFPNKIVFPAKASFTIYIYYCIHMKLIFWQHLQTSKFKKQKNIL